MSEPLDIHMIAIGGTGMAPLACLLQELGHRVGGSDGPLYPPMSTLLEEAGIEPLVGFDPAHLRPPLDLVIVGNAVPRTNPEAEAVEASSIPRISMPEALSRFFLGGRQPLVVAGTHGKTTTTSIASWVYTDCDRDPGYLIGGVAQNLGTSFRRGGGERFVIEGDEYNAAYFDRGPKFLHYQPQTVILTSVEYDHADLYPDPASLIDAYGRLVELIPEDGLLVAHGDSAQVVEVARRASCPLVRYGLGDGNTLRPLGPIVSGPEGSRFTLDDPEAGETEILIPLGGAHNVLNAMAVWAVARHDGLAAADVARSLASFRGVRRRMEELGTGRGVTVVDDFAHHPTAVGATLEALRDRYPGRRLVTAFEPRSLTAGRDFLHDAYREAFEKADRVFIAPIFHAGRLSESERLDVDTLVAELEGAGVTSTGAESQSALERDLLAELEDGDVVVTMSSGSFDGLPHRLLEALTSPPGTDRH
jgi:UDP-N-acetylmuramate: L-alanyl-gamma-D-glutamyl-meso-diaminopimelate ligase